MIAFDKANRRAWVGQATAYRQTFARLCAHSVDAVLDAAKVGPGVHVLDGLLCGGGLLKIETDMFAFTHRIDPESWWSGPAQGLASMGAVVINQTPEMACVKMALSLIHISEPT